MCTSAEENSIHSKLNLWYKYSLKQVFLSSISQDIREMKLATQRRCLKCVEPCWCQQGLFRDSVQQSCTLSDSDKGSHPRALSRAGPAAMFSAQRVGWAMCTVLVILSPAGSLVPSTSVAHHAFVRSASQVHCCRRRTEKRCSWTKLLMQDGNGFTVGDGDRAEARTAPLDASRVLSTSSSQGLRARLGRRIASIRDSRRIASFRQLLRNSTQWEEEEKEWLSPSMVMQPKVLGSVRLARTMAIMSGQTAKNQALVETERAVGAKRASPVAALDGSGVRRLHGALTEVVLAAQGQLEDVLDSEEIAAEDRRFYLLIDQWASGIAEAYSIGESRPTSQDTSISPITGRALFTPAPSSIPRPARAAEAAGLQQWPQAPALRASVAANPELCDLTDFDLSRFLALCKGDAHKALGTLIAHRKWLNGPGYGIARVADVNPSTPGMRRQIRTGKCFLLNKSDAEGRPVVIVRVDKHIPSAASVDESTLFIAMCLKEAEARLSDPHSSRFCVALDLGEASIHNIDYPLIKRLIYILTNFYPERLGVMLLHDAPSYFTRSAAPPPSYTQYLCSQALARNSCMTLKLIPAPHAE